MRYLLFYGYKETAGGAEDFHSAHETREAAEAAGIKEWSDGNVRLASWMHLAELKDSDLRVIARLNIPGTELADDKDEPMGLVWEPVE